MTDDQTANDECGICLETLTVAVTLPCTHKFCANCLDGWKSKFGSSLSLKEEKSKSCPICRKKIPPSKDMLSQLEYQRQLKLKLEGIGDTTSEIYSTLDRTVKRLEAEIGTYDGKGIDYDRCMDIPKYIYDAVKTDDIKSVMDWLGSPVDKKRLDARDPDHLNSTLLHLSLATDPVNSDLMSILLQYGADVNALDANGVNPLSMIITQDSLEQAKILLEWGVEMILPPDIVHSIQDISEQSNKDASFILQLELGLPS